MTHQQMFDHLDLPMLVHAVSIFPNLEYACYASKLAGTHLQFPIQGHAEVDPLFKLEDISEKIRRRNIQPGDFERFFPKEFFPIEDPHDFLGKVLAALSWGDTVHYHERFLKQPHRFSPMSHLRRT